jgi:hypothetical protein
MKLNDTKIAIYKKINEISLILSQMLKQLLEVKLKCIAIKKQFIDLGGQLNPASKFSRKNTFKHFHCNTERHFKQFTLSVRKWKIIKSNN